MGASVCLAETRLKLRVGGVTGCGTEMWILPVRQTWAEDLKL